MGQAGRVGKAELSAVRAGGRGAKRKLTQGLENEKFSNRWKISTETTRRVVRNVSRDNAPCVATYFFVAFLTFLASFFWAGVFTGSFFVFFFASCVLAIFVFLLATHGRRTVFLRTHYAYSPAPWRYFFHSY